MAKGEIPVSYIVALIIALVVIAIVVFMFFTHTGLFSQSSTEAQCDAKVVQYCISWRRDDPTFASNGPMAWSTFAPGCADIGSTAQIRSRCEALLGQLKANGESCQQSSECLSGYCDTTSKVCAAKPG